MGAEHLGHLDEGSTIDSFVNARSATTFKKLPMHNPIIKTNMPTTKFKLSISNLFRIDFFR